MEDTGGEIAYPIIEQICHVNRRMIEEFDGSFIPPDNVRNIGSLEYILDAIRHPVFGHNMYSSLKEKAMAIAYHIISRHVFYDGNKRTAMHVALEFLHANGVSLQLDDTIIDLSVEIAKGEASQTDLLDWLHSHQ